MSRITELVQSIAAWLGDVLRSGTVGILEPEQLGRYGSDFARGFGDDGHALDIKPEDWRREQDRLSLSPWWM